MPRASTPWTASSASAFRTDDATGPQADYIDEQPVTNDLAVITPYVVTFRCFTPELARVIGGFATSPNAFIDQVHQRPAGGNSGDDGSAGRIAPMGLPPGGLRRAIRPLCRDSGRMPPPAAGAGQPQAGKGGLQTVLKEQLLRVTLEVEIVKLLPKSIKWNFSKNITKRFCSALCWRG